MKRLALISLGIASTLHADGLALSQMKIEALTPIDTLPTTDALATSFGGDPLPTLVDIAKSTDPALDFGVQLRAIRALPSYCTTAMPCDAASLEYQTLVALLPNPPVAAAPRDLLRLRAAIEAFGLVGRTSDQTDNYTVLVPYLSNTSRDIRAAAAAALGTLCNTQAQTALLQRSAAENAPGGSQQVLLAISAALRDLHFNCGGSQ